MTQARPDGRAPLVTAGYGVPKCGKTTDAIYAFPDAFFIAQPGAVSPAAWILGDPIPSKRVRPATSIDGITKAIPAIAKLGFREAVIDDFTLISQVTIRETAKHARGWKIWLALRNKLIDLRAQAEACGMMLHFTAHERPPAQGRRGRQKGGLDLPGTMPADFAAIASFCARIVYEPGVSAAWPFCYSTQPNNDFVVADRGHVVQGRAPLNLAEILRAAGYQIDRPAAMKWIEAAALDHAPLIQPLTAVEERAYMRQLAEKHATIPKPQLRWFLRDVSARAALMRRGILEELAGYWTEPAPMEAADVLPTVEDADDDGDDGDDSADAGTAAPEGSDSGDLAPLPE